MPVAQYLRGIWDALKAKPESTDRVTRLWNRRMAGVVVNHDTAFQVAAVWACIDVIASALAASDWNVYAGVRHGGNKRDLPEDGLQYLLNTRANPEMTSQAAKRALMIAAVGIGNGYAEIERDMSNRVSGLWPLHPDRVEPRRDSETGVLFYRVSQGSSGGFVDISAENILHIRGASLVGFAGDDMVGRAIRSISSAIALDQFAVSYYGNNAQPGMVFRLKSKLDDAAYERLKKEIDEKHSGAKNAYRPLVLDGGDWDVSTPGGSAEQAQLTEIKHVSIEEICRWFRVPPHKIAHLLRATNNNIEHQGLEFSRDTCRPWRIEIEQECDYKLVPYRVNKFVEIDLDWAEQGDYKSRAEAYQILRNMGAFSANDVLKKLGENTIGPDGDIRIVQGASIKLEDVGKNMLPNDPPADPPGQSDVDDNEEEVLVAWVASIYARAQGRYRAHRSECRRRGQMSQEEADKSARSEAEAFLEERLAELSAHLKPYGIEAEKTAVQFGVDCVSGNDHKDQAKNLFDALRGQDRWARCTESSSRTGRRISELPVEA